MDDIVITRSDKEGIVQLKHDLAKKISKHLRYFFTIEVAQYSDVSRYLKKYDLDIVEEIRMIKKTH